LGFVTQTRAGFMTRDPRGEDVVADPPDVRKRQKYLFSRSIIV
jgi:hypothetical protein